MRKALFSVLLMLGISANAALSEEDVYLKDSFESKYFSVDEVQIEEVEEDLLSDSFQLKVRNYLLQLSPTPTNTNNSPAKNNPKSSSSTSSPEISDWNAIITIGKSLWEIVVSNKAVVNFSTDHASALPLGVDNVQLLSQWKGPKTRLYRIKYFNKFKTTVVDFTYRLIYSYDGSYKDRGQYIAHASVYPVNLSVKWGYTFNVNMIVPPSYNVGTEENPLAQMELHLNWILSNPMTHIQNTNSYFLKGDGDLLALEIEK